MNDINALINSSIVLDPKKQLVLLRKYKETGLINFRNELICGYYKMIKSIVKKYKSNLSFEELFNEGIIGLIKAIESFDLNKSSSFSTYAYKAIKTAVMDSTMLMNNQITYTPEFLVKKFKFYKLLASNPNIDNEEIKKILNVSDKTIYLFKKEISVIYYENDSVDDNIEFKESKYFKSLDFEDNIEDVAYQNYIINYIFTKCGLTDEEKTALNYLYIKDFSAGMIESLGYDAIKIRKDSDKAFTKIRKTFYQNGIKYN